MLMSPPTMNVSPVPVMSSPERAGSLFTTSTARRMPKYIAGVRALRLSGRSTTQWAKGPWRSKCRWGVPSQSPSGGRGVFTLTLPCLAECAIENLMEFIERHGLVTNSAVADHGGVTRLIRRDQPTEHRGQHVDVAIAHLARLLALTEKLGLQGHRFVVVVGHHVIDL